MDHELENPWTLYVTKQRTSNIHEKNVKEWEDRLEKIQTFPSVESFWEVTNNLRSASEMTNDVGDFYLFKNGIKPEWEDLMNVDGGRWLMIPDSVNVDDLWLKVQLALIGHMLEDLMDFVCGAELAIRRKSRFKIAVWIKATDNDTTLKIGNLLKSLTGVKALEFQQHKQDKSKFSIS